MSDPAPPRIIADRYEVGDVIGQGGHGWVYRARDRQTGEQVAVKMLNDVAARDPQLIERLKREQQALAVLAGTAAVKLVDLCMGPGGKLCLVMELLDGVDLETRLEELEGAGQRMTTAQLLPLLAPIVDTIDRAHGAGILHRDLKPANVFLMRDGSVRLLDFGLARIRSAQPLTAAGMVMGSPSYIAPEVWKGRSEAVDQRVDVYSFGVLVYRALASRPPFAGDSLQEKYTAATSAPRPSLHALRPDLPADIDGWVRQILAIDPGSRFHTLRAAWNALHSSLHLPEPADGPVVRTPTGPAPPAKKKLSGAAGQRAIASAWRSATDVLKRLVEVIPSPSSPPRLPETSPGPSGQAEPAARPLAGAGAQVPPLPPPPVFPVPHAAQPGPLPPPAPPPPKAATPQAPGARPLAPPPRAPREPPNAARAAAPRPPRQAAPPPPPRQAAPPPPRAARAGAPSASKPTPADPSAQTQVALEPPPPSAASLFHASQAAPTKLADQGGLSDKRSFVSEFLSQSVLDMDSSPAATAEDDVVGWLGATESKPAVEPPGTRHVPPPPAPKPPSPRSAAAKTPEPPPVKAPPEPPAAEASKPSIAEPEPEPEAPRTPEPIAAKPAAPPAADAVPEPARKSEPRAARPTPPAEAADSTSAKPKQEKKPKAAAKARGNKKSSRRQRKRKR